jgi:hypothetical protein
MGVLGTQGHAQHTEFNPISNNRVSTEADDACCTERDLIIPFVFFCQGKMARFEDLPELGQDLRPDIRFNGKTHSPVGFPQALAHFYLRNKVNTEKTNISASIVFISARLKFKKSKRLQEDTNPFGPVLHFP